MDSQHRHDLQENDLAYALTHWGEIWAKYGNQILWALLAVAVLVAGSRFILAQQHAARENDLRQLALATDPFAARSLADSTSNQVTRARALLLGGDLLLERVKVPVTSPDGQKQRERDLTDAKAMYEQVLQIKGLHKLYAINARLGLATVTENQQDFAAAEGHYKVVQDLAGKDVPRLALMAQARLAMLERAKQPVVFGAEPLPPSQAPALQFPLVPDDQRSPLQLPENEGPLRLPNAPKAGR